MKPDYFGTLAVRLLARVGTGKPITGTEVNGKKPKIVTATEANVYVSDLDAGQRVANAIQHAAFLCGASVAVF